MIQCLTTSYILCWLGSLRGFILYLFPIHSISLLRKWPINNLFCGQGSPQNRTASSVQEFFILLHSGNRSSTYESSPGLRTIQTEHYNYNKYSFKNHSMPSGWQCSHQLYKKKVNEKCIIAKVIVPSGNGALLNWWTIWFLGLVNHCCQVFWVYFIVWYGNRSFRWNF